MGKVSDYITGLEGKENLDPIVIASTLLELHNEEMGTATSKIATLEQEIESNKTLIGERDEEIKTQKAKNWDLANRIPAPTNDQTNQNKDSDIDVSDPEFDDFFVKEK